MKNSEIKDLFNRDRRRFDDETLLRFDKLKDEVYGNNANDWSPFGLRFDKIVDRYNEEDLRFSDVTDDISEVFRDSRNAFSVFEELNRTKIYFIDALLLLFDDFDSFWEVFMSFNKLNQDKRCCYVFNKIMSDDIIKLIIKKIDTHKELVKMKNQYQKGYMHKIAFKIEDIKNFLSVVKLGVNDRTKAPLENHPFISRSSGEKATENNAQPSFGRIEKT